MAQSVQIKSVRPWHEQIVDWMLQNPHLTQGQCAIYFHKTEAWLSSVINSDIFREYKSRRFADHHENVSHSVIERVSGLAGLSIEVLEERIKAERDDIPLGIVLDSATLMLKSMGYGPKVGPTAPAATINVNLNGAPAEVLAQARDDLRKTHVENTVEAEDAEIVNEGDDLVALALDKAEETVREDTHHEPEQSRLPIFGEP